MFATGFAYMVGVVMGASVTMLSVGIWYVLGDAIREAWLTYTCECYKHRNVCECEVCREEHFNNEFDRFNESRHFDNPRWSYPPKKGHH
jgi:hypothetical protein